MSNNIENSFPAGLIATKLAAPALDSRLVARDSLLEALAHGAGWSILSVAAPAGSGKSTLIGQLHDQLRAQGIRTCWISLDEEDNSPATFAAYLASALSSLGIEAIGRQLSILKAAPVPDYPALLERIAIHLHAVKEPVAVFLDDFQHLTDSRIIAFLKKLLLHLPPVVKLIIASRALPPLEFARIRPSGLLVEIDQEDLCFSVPLAGEVLRRSHGLELAPLDLEALVETTEGWPAGVQLAALAIRRHKGSVQELIRQFSGRDRGLTSYLIESVLNSQPEAVKVFLLRTSLLRRMSAELCEAITGQTGCAEMLLYLERNNLFIVALDRVGQWYRYHHLFGEFLQNELRRSEPALFQSLCDKAAGWCEANEQMTEAIQYALEGCLFDRAVDLIADRAPVLSQLDGDHYTVLDWMRRLPTAFHDRRPEIPLSHAWSLAFSRDITKAFDLAEKVNNGLQDPERWPTLSARQRISLQFLSRVVQAIALGCFDQIRECMERCQSLRRQIPETEPFQIASVCNAMSYAHYASREFELATQAAIDGYLFARQAPSAYAMIWADFMNGLAELELGRLKSAREYGLRAETVAAQAGAVKGYSSALAALLNAEAAIQRCDFDAACQYMQTGKSFTALYGPLEPLLVAFRSEARTLSWNFQLEQGLAVLRGGQETAVITSQPRLYVCLAVEEATQQLQFGEAREAVRIAGRLRLLAQESAEETFKKFRWLRDLLLILDVRICLQEEDPSRALKILTQLIAAPQAERHFSMMLALRTLKAVALWRSNRPSDSLRELDRVVQLAAPEGHAFPVASAGPLMVPMLRAIEQKRADSADADLLLQRRFEHRILALLTGESATPPKLGEAARAAGLSEPLTERQIELLKFVEAGLGNKQLADRLLISESTVKWHLHNIFEKIGVRNRTAAVARARELALF